MKKLLVLTLVLAACSHTETASRTTQGEEVEKSTTAAPAAMEAALKNLLAKGYERYRKSDFAGAIQQWEPIWLSTGRASDGWTPTLLYYCYLATGQHGKALQLAESTIQETPNRPLGYQQAGLAQLWMGRPDEAEDLLRRSAEFADHTPNAFFYLGVALQRQGKKAEAEAEFQKAQTEYLAILNANPTDFTANYELAYNYLYRSVEVEDAMKRISAARESLRSNPDVDLTPDKGLYLGFYLPLLEGMYLTRQNKPKESLTKLLTAIQASPSGAKADLAEVYHFLGRNLWDLGEKSRARNFLAKAVELDPHGPYSKVKIP